jgi:hypothetical protein
MEGPIGFPFLIKEIDDAMSVGLVRISVFVDRLINYTVIGYCRFLSGCMGLESIPKFRRVYALKLISV